MDTLDQIAFYLFTSRLSNKQMYNDIEMNTDPYTKSYQRGFADGWKRVLEDIEELIKESQDDKNGKVGTEESHD